MFVIHKCRKYSARGLCRYWMVLGLHGYFRCNVVCIYKSDINLSSYSNNHILHMLCTTYQIVWNLAAKLEEKMNRERK